MINEPRIGALPVIKQDAQTVKNKAHLAIYPSACRNDPTHIDCMSSRRNVLLVACTDCGREHTTRG